MKKLLLLSAAVVSMLFNTACSSDDDSSSGDSENSIVGSWQLVSAFTNGEDSTTECDTMDTISFTSTQFTTISHFVDFDSNECVQEDPFTSSYSIEGNKIITGEDGEIDFSIQGDILIFTFENTDVDEGEPNDIDITTFRRI